MTEEQRTVAKSRSRAWRKANPHRLKGHYLSSKFGITQAQYDRMHSDQSGLCAICNQPETAKRGGKIKCLAVDHCHATGKIRGLLCQKCNVALGSFGDTEVLLLKAIEYINK